jgi:nitrogen fixation NifU-like protein
MYSQQVLEHFEHPRNVGELENPTAFAEVQNPACGDVMQLWLRLDFGRIVEVRYRAKGCVPAIACGSALTEMLLDKTTEEARRIRRVELVMRLGGLPTASLHASHLAIDVLAKALNQISANTRANHADRSS